VPRDRVPHVSGAPAAGGPSAPRREADLALGLLIAASRVPFLAAGYGTDTDAWKLAFAAREIGRTGHYAPSRLPGFPVQEYVSALVWRGGPLALNGLTALWSVIAALLFLRLWRRLGGRDAALATLAFAFVPALYVGSVSAMDYLWAEACVLGALNLALEGRALATGVLLGVATGCRITSAALGLPLLMLLWPALRPPRAARAALFAGVAGAIAALCYLPAYLRFGTGFLSFYEPQGAQKSLGDFLAGMLKPGPAPFPPALIAGQATVGVFGPIGALAVGIAMLAALLAAARRGPGTDRALALPRGVAPALGVGLLIPLALYLRLPHDEGYLIPALPFVLLLLAAATPRAVLRACLAAMVVSPFLLGVDVVPPKKGLTPEHRSPFARELKVSSETAVVDPLRGPLLMDADKRERTMAVAARTLPALARWPDDAFLMVGVLHPVLFYYAPDNPRHPVYTDLLRAPDLADMLQHGRRVFYLPDVRRRARRMAGYDPLAAGAAPLFPDDDAVGDSARGPRARGLPPTTGH